MTPTNPYEDAGRARKAAALFVACVASGIGKDMASAADAKDWALAAQLVDVNPPSDATIALVIEMLERKERVERRAKKRV